MTFRAQRLPRRIRWSALGRNWLVWSVMNIERSRSAARQSGDWLNSALNKGISADEDFRPKKIDNFKFNL